MKKPVIIFDGVCNLCNKSVQFIIRHDPDAYFTFAPFQSAFGEAIVSKYNLNTGEPESLLLIEDQRLHNKSTAALKIARKLNGLWPVCYIFIVIPKPIRDFFYDLIAKNRNRVFAKSSQCLIPDPRNRKRFIL